MRKAVAIAACLSALTRPVWAQDAPPLLVQSPCGWFVKTAPDVWSSRHVIRLDTWGVVVGELSFRPGTYRVDDGTDAYEFVERKCGSGRLPGSVYSKAMPLPFGLFPWYQ